MKQLNELLFRAVCLCTAALMLLLSLLCSIRLAAANERAVKLSQEIAELERETALLRARYESRMSLEEIERLAVEEYGMQRCSPGQIIIIEDPIE